MYYMFYTYVNVPFEYFMGTNKRHTQEGMKVAPGRPASVGIPPLLTPVETKNKKINLQSSMFVFRDPSQLFELP